MNAGSAPRVRTCQTEACARAQDQEDSCEIHAPDTLGDEPLA